MAVSEDDTCEFDKNRCMRKQTFRPFFHFRFFYIPIFMIGKNIGTAAATPADAHTILRSFLKSVM